MKKLRQIFNWRILIHSFLISAVLCGTFGYVNYRVLVGEELNLGGYRVTGIKNDMAANSPLFLVSQSAVKAYIDALVIAGGNVEVSLSIEGFGAVEGSSTTTSRNANLTAINNAIATAGNGQKIVVPPGNYFFPGSVINLTSGTKKFNIQVLGDCWFLPGGGFTMGEGSFHYFNATGIIDGGNSGGTDSTSYAAYMGYGLYLKNCDKCEVHINRILNFKEGIRAGGESTTTPKGTQYCHVYYNQIRSCFIQIHVTTTGTTNGATPGDVGNWSNSNFFIGGQLGGGINESSGGTFGVLIQKDPTSNQGGTTGTNPFNYNLFLHLGLEGLRWGFYAENADFNDVIGGRLETNAVRSPFYLRENTANGLECRGNDLSQFPIAYETSFAPGGKGISTKLPRLLTANGVPAADFVVSNGNLYTNILGDDPSVRQSTNGMFAIGGFNGAFFNNRYALHAIHPESGVDDYVSYDGHRVVVTGVTFTVPPDVSRVECNPITTQTIILPPAASWIGKLIYIKNAHPSTSVTISGPAAGNTTVLGPNVGTVYASNGAAWLDYMQKPAVKYALDYSQITSATVGASSTSTFSIYNAGATNLAQTNLGTADLIEFRGTGDITTAVSTTPNIVFTFSFGGLVRTVTRNALTYNASGKAYRYIWRITPTGTGTSTTGFGELELYIDGEPLFFSSDTYGSGINTISPSANVQIAFSASNSSNTVISQQNTIEVKRK